MFETIYNAGNFLVQFLRGAGKLIIPSSGFHWEFLSVHLAVHPAMRDSTFKDDKHSEEHFIGYHTAV